MKYSFLFIAFILFISTDIHSQKDSNSQMLLAVDSTVHSLMSELHIPGAVVTIVKDGKLICNRGYGYSDIEAKKDVDPNKSIFRMASITKPFTAMAILKMVEDGKLTLNQDIRPLIENKYEFNWEHPISIRNVLTHMSGLDYSSIGSHKGAVRNGKSGKIKLLDQGHMPGDHFSYSNIAFGLLGHVIEKVSGMTYPEYMKRTILDPLGMNNSTFDTELPLELEKNKANTYLWKNGKNNLQERQILNFPAASSLESTGGDMALFMNALLHPEILEEQGIISISTFEEMSSPQLGEKMLNSLGYGLALGNTRNQSTIFHSGGVNGFCSLFNIFPDANLGVFVAQSNRLNTEHFTWWVSNKVYDYLLPTVEADLSFFEDPESIKIPIRKFEGTYVAPVHKNSTFEKAEKLMNEKSITIEVMDNEIIEIFGKPFKRISNLTFAGMQENKEKIHRFRADEKGNIIRLLSGPESYFKTPWFRQMLITQILVGLAFLFFFICWIIGVYKWFSKKYPNPSSTPFFQRWIHGMSIGYFITFFAMLGAYFFVETIKHGVPIPFKVPLILFSILGFLSLLTPWALWSNYRAKTSSKRKVLNYISILSIVYISWLFWELKLIGMWY